MKKVRITGLSVLVLLTAQAAMSQVKNEFSAKQAVDYGLKNSVPVKNALIDILIQKQTNREITAAAFPQVSGSVAATHYFDVPIQPIPDFINPLVYGILEDKGVRDAGGNPIKGPESFPDLPFSIFQKWSSTVSVDVKQLLFDGQVFVGLQARKAVINFYTKSAEVTQEQIRANIYKIYYQLVVGKQQLASVDANIDRFTKLLHDVNEIYKNGFAERLDIDKVQVQLNNLNTEKDKLLNQLEAGNAGLKFLINMPQKEELVLTDTLNESELKSGLLDESYNYNDRKEMQLLQIGARLNKYNIRRYQLSKLPTVSVFGSYAKNVQSNEFDFFNKSANWLTTSLVGLNISVPIFSGFAKNAQIQKARYELQKSNNNIEQTKQSIENDVSQARIKMKSALLTMDNQKRNIALAEKVYNTTRKKYDQGLGNNQEIYNAQAELKVAQTNYYSAVYDAIIAKIDYQQATGKLQ